MKPMTPAQCAEQANVSLSLIYAVLRSGRLKAMRIGSRGRGCWRILAEDFEAWLQTCRVSDPPPQSGSEGHLEFIT